MAKIYGGRWRLSGDTLGRGGQSEVFRVVDDSGALQGEYALKRVRNPGRHDRFKAEIEAIRRLQHPNIITLTDHSALEDLTGEIERQYLVMPIASGGDLAAPGRVALYKDNIEGTLQVALQLASALEHAHVAAIIHRDVKPANVLFTGNGHEIWLADFGICLIRETERNTELHEIVGPRSFMAPELEAGGRLEVTPSADIYSLGKVIYFMISGGTILPREELNDPRFSHLFERGDRYRRLQLLLDRMICKLSGRLKTMSEVVAELKAIEAWEGTAMSVALDATSRDTIARLQGRARSDKQAAEEAAAARASREQLVAGVRQSFSSWAELELRKIAAHIQTDQIKVSVLQGVPTSLQEGAIPLGDRSFFEEIAGWELVLEMSEPPRGHALQLLLCSKRTVTVTVSVGPIPPSLPKQETPVLAVLSAYARPPSAGGPGAPPRRTGFVTRRQSVGQVIRFIQRPTPKAPFPRSATLTRMTATFRPEYSLHISFKADEWNIVLGKVHVQLQESLAVFLDFVMEEHPSIGV
jgi:serine/threonine protein kinase